MITYPQQDEILYYTGKVFTVEWYYQSNGAIPALDYYRRLAEGEQDRLDYMVKYLADNPIGTRLPQTLYRIEDWENKISAFKPRAERFFSFTTVGRKIIITNAYHKHSQKMAKQDLERLKVAAAYREDYLQRVAAGEYYEARD